MSFAHMSPATRQLCSQALIAAIETGHHEITSVHLLLAVLEDPSAPLAVALEQQRVSRGDVIATVQRAGPGDPITNMPLAPEADQIIAAAAEVAGQRHRRVEPGDIATALVRSPDTTASRLLRDLGASPSTLLDPTRH